MKSVQEQVDAKIKHTNGKVSGTFPFRTGPMIVPFDPTMQSFPQVDGFYQHSICLWVPEFLWPGLYPHGTPDCPNGCSAKEVKANGWDPNGGRRMIGETELVTLLSFRYECLSCKRSNQANKNTEEEKVKQSFYAYDPMVMQRSPLLVRESFPFIMTANLGVEKTIAARLTDDVLHGKSFQAAAGCLHQAHVSHFMKRQGQYLSMVDLWRRGAGMDSYHGVRGNESLKHATGTDIGHSTLSVADQKAFLSSPPKFSEFDDPEGYGGYSARPAYLEEVFKTGFYSTKVLGELTQEDVCNRKQQMIGGQHLAGDASFKLMKKLKEGGGRPKQKEDGSALAIGQRAKKDAPYLCQYTVLNEFRQVVCQVAMTSSHTSEAEAVLVMMLRERFAARGMPLPLTFATDECCVDR